MAATLNKSVQEKTAASPLPLGLKRLPTLQDLGGKGEDGLPPSLPFHMVPDWQLRIPANDSQEVVLAVEAMQRLTLGGGQEIWGTTPKFTP